VLRCNKNAALWRYRGIRQNSLRNSSRCRRHR
jgi:hypothetical protein